MNAETGDDEEDKDADVTKRARELDQSKWVLKKVVGESFMTLVYSVIENDAECGSASKRVDATQARPVRGDRGGIRHYDLAADERS